MPQTFSETPNRPRKMNSRPYRESTSVHKKTLYFKGLVMAFKRKSEESQSTVFEVEFSKKIWNQKSAQNVFSVK